MRKLKSAARNGTRLEQLRILAVQLADQIEKIRSDVDPEKGGSQIAQLSKQYRETLKEIDELEGAKTEEHDELNDILRQRELKGLPGAVRQDRSAV